MLNTSLLERLSYRAIEALPLDTIINPNQAPESFVTIAEARTAACMQLLLAIPDDVINQLRRSNYYGEDPASYAEKWNQGVAIDRGVAEASQAFAIPTMIRILSMCGPETFSRLKEIQVFAGVTAIVSQYLLEQTP